MMMMVMVMGVVVVGGIRWGCTLEEICRTMKRG
jgi:hypothetical protein